MEEIHNTQKALSFRQLFSVTVWQLRETIARHLSNKGVGRTCHVVVTRNGQVLTLAGSVDSESTHFEILSMIPDEERCVQDNIQVQPSPV